MNCYFLAAAVLFLLHSASFAWSGVDSSGPINGSATPIVRGNKAGGKNLRLDAPTKNPGTIRGTCSVAQSTSNPIEGPCADMLLVLTDAEGNEVEKTRTSTQGHFDFEAEPGKAYKIALGSKTYLITAPTELVHGGDEVSLEIMLR